MAQFTGGRSNWRGYLWQGRFGSAPLDERHLVAAMRYVEANPVAAGLVTTATEYPWSSARTHTLGLPNPLLSPCFLTQQITDWAAFLASAEDARTTRHLEHQVRTGRPYGSEDFLASLERQVGQRVRRLSPGPRPRR